MLWRTRPLGALVALGLVVLATFPLVETHIALPIDQFGPDIARSGVRLYWPLLVGGAVAGLAVWVWLILRRPVGEVALHRHVVTVIAVGLIGYLWMVMPSVLALIEVEALRRVDISDRTLESDHETLARYGKWTCIPPRAWKDEEELAQLRNALGRYRKKLLASGDWADVELSLAPSATHRGCDEQDARELKGSYLTYGSVRDIEALQDAGRLGSRSAGPNQFSHLRASLAWFALAALGLGLLAAASSYPSYVWRRTFLRR